MYRKIEVLIADDDSTTMQYYHAVLSKAHDIQMIAATTVSNRVVFLAQEKQPDVVLIDYAMYPIDGFTLMETIHDELPDMSVILLGGRETMREISLESGAADYLSIPITPRNLLDSIRRVGRTKKQ